jgi:hypothetical protein
MWDTVLGGGLAIAGSAVTQVLIHVLTSRRELSNRRREFQRKSLIELRDALLSAATAANDAAIGSTTTGDQTEILKLNPRAIVELAKADSACFCVESDELRKVAHHYANETRALILIQPSEVRRLKAIEINQRFGEVIRVLGECLRENL